MKKLIFLVLLGIVMISCQGVIGDLNEWWRDDVLKNAEEEETATVTIELDWSGDE